MGGTRGVHFAAEVGGALRAWPLAWVELRGLNPWPPRCELPRARGRGNLGSSQALSTVHASGCTLLLLYFLLYAVDAQAPSNPASGLPLFRRTSGSTRVHRSPSEQARWPARASRRPGL